MTTNNCQTPANCPFDAVKWGEMMQTIEGLSKSVDLGFDGVITRLDKQNGRTTTLENRTDDIERWKDMRSGVEKAAIWILTIILGSGGLLGALKLLGRI